VSIPYASVASETGPSSTGIGTPLYPGPVAVALPGALQTEGAPAAFAELFADPVLAASSYPAYKGQEAQATYSPPAGSTTGVGNASSSSAEGGSIADAATSSVPLAKGQFSIASSTTHSSTTIGASSVSDVAESNIHHVSLLAGLVQIASIASSASTTSDGNNGTEKSTLQVGAVTVAGQPAYIGPDGLHLAKTANNVVGAVAAFNSALVALQQAGISVTTIAPTSTVKGGAASVESGAVQIKFSDTNIPNPQGQVPVSLIGFEIDLGLTAAGAQATLLPALGAVAPPISPPLPAVSSPDITPASQAVTTVTPTAGGVQTNTSTASSASVGSLGTGTSRNTSTGGAEIQAQPASFIGMPTRLAWVVIAVILSIVACGPLLGYANWQLLRGRKS
jgi:hypothetical protein